MCECPELKTLIATSKIHHEAQSAAVEEIKNSINGIETAVKENREDMIKLKTEFNIFKAVFVALCAAVCGQFAALIFEYLKRGT